MKHTGWGAPNSRQASDIHGAELNFPAKNPQGFGLDHTRMVEDRAEVEKREGKVLMKGGVWLVPVEARFDGWEKL